MLHIAFLEPRIAGNTGNAIRMVAGTGATLHLIAPLFDLAEAKVRRAGLDYHDLAHVVVHRDLEAMLAALPEARVFAFTTSAATRFDIAYRPGDVLLFGPETTGLAPEVIAHPRVTGELRIPMIPGRRSMNLSNAAAVACYEAWRSLGYPHGT